MKEFYVIEGIINGGFWDERDVSFRGYLFCTEYDSEDGEDIKEQIKIASKGGPCKVTKIYDSK